MLAASNTLKHWNTFTKVKAIAEACDLLVNAVAVLNITPTLNPQSGVPKKAIAQMQSIGINGLCNGAKITPKNGRNTNKNIAPLMWIRSAKKANVDTLRVKVISRKQIKSGETEIWGDTEQPQGAGSKTTLINYEQQSSAAAPVSAIFQTPLQGEIGNALLNIFMGDVQSANANARICLEHGQLLLTTGYRSTHPTVLAQCREI